ncbi:hypothetical protein EE612_055445, partial [Oryza sativa]
LYVMDDALTEGPEPESQPVGRAQRDVHEHGPRQAWLASGHEPGVHPWPLQRQRGHRARPQWSLWQCPGDASDRRHRHFPFLPRLRPVEDAHLRPQEKNDAIVEYNVYIMH